MYLKFCLLYAKGLLKTLKALKNSELSIDRVKEIGLEASEEKQALEFSILKQSESYLLEALKTALRIQDLKQLKESASILSVVNRLLSPV